MENDAVTRDIFNALDTEKTGYVSKQHFINQMAEYLSQTEVTCSDYTLNKLNIVNKYPDLIDYENFKQFYEDLMESKKSSIKSLQMTVYDEESLMENNSDSDVYESELGPCMDINSSRSTLQGSVINLKEFPNRSKMFSSNSMDRRRSIGSYVPPIDSHVKKKFNNFSPAGSLRRRYNDMFSARSSLAGAFGTVFPTEEGKHGHVEDFDEVSCMTDSGVSVATEEVDRLFNNYTSVVGELSELKQKLDDSNSRYQKQRDLTRMHNDRIVMLEEQIRLLETSQNEDIKKKKKEFKVKMDSIQQKKDIENEKQKHADKVFRQEVLNRLNALESEYNASRSEYDRMKHECDLLLKEKDDLKKELKVSNKRCQELESTLHSYKEAVGSQISDLQKERDNAEKINKELHDKVQEMHVTYRCQDPNNWTSSSSLNSPLQNRPQSWTGPFNFLGHSISKNSLDTGSAVSGSPSCTTISQLENIVYRLTMENRNLVEKVTHLEALEFYQRKRTNISNNMSVADEMDHLNIAELKNALASEQEIATRLQLYVMGLTNRLMLAGYIEAFRHG